jgi:superfamily II DNA/RNA helicase
MIFVDTIDEYISITTYLRNGLSSSSIAGYRTIVVRHCHGAREVSSQEEYLIKFRNRETRVLVCTSTYHISRDNNIMGNI